MASGTQKHKKKIKKCVLKIGIALFSILLGCIVAECAIRFLRRDTMVLFSRNHTDAEYGKYKIRRLRPNSEFRHTSIDGSWKFITNKQGFRSNYDFSYDKPPGVLRIIALGDSHTLGYEVRQDHTFSAIIEKYLSNNGYKAEVFNMGIGDFSAAEELVLLENEGIRYKPDYVILGFCENDFDDNIKAGLFELNGGELRAKNKEYLPSIRTENFIYRLPFTHFLSENSYFYNLLFNTTWAYYKKVFHSKSKEQLPAKHAISTEELADYRFRLAGCLIERMYSFCKKNNIKFVILSIPAILDEDKLVFRAGVNSPFPDEMYQRVVKSCDVFIESEKVLKDYHNLIELCREHGQHHISEFTHCLLGVETARAIITKESNQ